MAIVKIKKKDSAYVQIDKRGIEDSRLSWGATGLLTYLIGRPDNWSINITHLATVKTDKRDITRKFLNELREFNYCHYFESRKSGKVVETTYLIFEIPTPPELAQDELEVEEGYMLCYKPFKKPNKSSVSPITDLPETVEPKAALPVTAKQPLIIIDNNNIDITNKDVNNIDLKNNTCNMLNFEKKKNRKGFLIQDRWEEFLIENLPGIDYQSNIQKQIKKLEKKDSEDTIKKYLLEVYTTGIEQNKTFEMIANTIATGTRINTPKPKSKKIEIVDETIPAKTKIEKSIAKERDPIVEPNFEEVILTEEEEKKALSILKEQGINTNTYSAMKRKSTGVYYKTLASVLKQAI
ncbi:MAG: hypothetical protein ACRC8F_04035 [Cetobacterium sp.]